MLKPILAIIVIIIVSSGIAWAGAQGSIISASLPLFALCASVPFILHWLGFIPGFIYQTEHYFDLTGSLSYLAAIAVAATHHPSLDTRGIVVCILIGVWAARLGSFLFLRVKKAGQDRRFNEIKTKFFRFMFTWTLGGAWVFVTMAAGLAAITSENQQPIGLYFYLGLALWVIGFGIEVIADSQKTAFRADASNAEKFITTGLWSKSRHPNYFGEILLWVGISIIALPALVGWQFVTLISPVFVTLLLIKVSGVKLLEEGGQKRWGDDPAYQEYLKNTPELVPFLGRTG